MIWYCLCTSYVLIYCARGQTSDPKVDIVQGTVIGTFNTCYEFYGIPFANSTSGINRFQAPKAPPLFEAPFIANRKGIKCLRPIGSGYEGIEDCLSLDVLTPTLNQTLQLPVMVWIKGREFDGDGELELSFENFIKKDVVIVTPNFRESIFGFLCLGTPTAPGNAGLKDIIAALQWIQQNIAAFGGDPDNVTVFGHGSGASAVDLLTYSNMSKGLFHKAISQSGTATAPWAVTRNNLKYAIHIAEALGHDIIDLDDLSNIFTRVSAAALMAVINELELTDNSLAFAPCIERDVSEDIEPFLLKSPYQILNAGEQLDIPFMTGFVDREGTVRMEEAVNGNWLAKMQESFIDFLQSDLGFESDEEKHEIAGQILSFYFGNNSIDMESLNNYISYQGDTIMLVSAIRESRMRVSSSTTPVYLYQFSYKGSLGSVLEGPLNIDEASHGEELAYLFHEHSNNTTVAENDLAICDILIERWTNFAKSGTPSSDTSSTDWRPVTVNNTYYLRFLNDAEVNRNEGGSLDIALENPHPATMAFWQDIYNNYFLDAVSRWHIFDRDIGDENVQIAENENKNNGTDTENGDNTDSEDNTESEDDGSNSASTIIGYTFVVVALLSIVNNLDVSEIML